MFSGVSIIVACSAGLFGAVAALLIGNRHTRSLRLLGWGAIAAGLALAGLSFSILRWCLHGYEPIDAWILPLAGLILLLVMTAQNWFVFYENQEDAVQSVRPTLVLLAAGVASMGSAWFGEDRLNVLHLIWAGAISLAIVFAIRPVSRSIEVSGSALIGVPVGVCKLLVPSTGIIVFVLARMLAPLRRPSSEEPPLRPAIAPDRQSAWLNLLLLLWEIGCLPLLTLINGARVAPAPVMSDLADLLYRQKGTGSVAGQMPRAARDTVVLILVLAIHVLCGVVIARD